MQYYSIVYTDYVERAVILRCHYPGVKSLVTAAWLWFKCLVVLGMTGRVPGDGGTVAEWWDTRHWMVGWGRVGEG